MGANRERVLRISWGLIAVLVVLGGAIPAPAQRSVNEGGIAADPESVAEALREAQAYVRKHPDHPEWAEPYYWAAWVLWGLP